MAQPTDPDHRPSIGAAGSASERIAFEGKFIQIIQRGGWEFARRVGNRPAVAIVAITDDRRLVLVEQFRPPVGATALELPAGLVGDDPGHAGEAELVAAQRELLEETGYEAAHWRRMLEVVSSAGLSDERVAIYKAWKLKRSNLGGGVGTEAITIHEPPLEEVEALVEARCAAGAVVDSRVLMGLHLALRHMEEIGG
ncbi:MAG: NUDIX hydrolase [Phycisphaeraceae bacterium]|nr:NUDIX hydrolase [Phycisphaeraceae bacterium]